MSDDDRALLGNRRLVYFVILVVILWVTLVVTWVVYGASYSLTNPGFETGDMTGWVLSGSCDSAMTTGHSGSWAGSLVVPGDTCSGVISQSVGLSVGSVITVSGWVFCNGSCSLSIGNGGGSSSPVSVGGWQEIVYTGTSVSGDFVVLYVSNIDDSAGFDDFALSYAEPAVTPSPTPLSTPDVVGYFDALGGVVNDPVGSFYLLVGLIVMVVGGIVALAHRR